MAQSLHGSPWIGRAEFVVISKKGVQEIQCTDEGILDPLGVFATAGIVW